MEIDRLRHEGRCYRCKEKGHMSKDCPKRKEYKDVCLMTIAEGQEEGGVAKIEEVKD